MATKVEMKGLDSLERLLRQGGAEAERMVKKYIKGVLVRAKLKVKRAAGASISDDPRKAVEAVRASVYRQVLGGNVNILPSRKDVATAPYKKERKIDRNPGQRGGNRMARSGKTERMDEYWGKSRAFALIFTDSGAVRMRRGRIRSRGWFMPAAQNALAEGAEELKELVEREMVRYFN